MRMQRVLGIVAYNWIYVITFFTDFLLSWKKKLAWKISQYSQENTPVFIKKRLAC